MKDDVRSYEGKSWGESADAERESWRLGRDTEGAIKHLKRGSPKNRPVVRKENLTGERKEGGRMKSGTSVGRNARTEEIVRLKKHEHLRKKLPNPKKGEKGRSPAKKLGEKANVPSQTPNGGAICKRGREFHSSRLQSTKQPEKKFPEGLSIKGD